MIKFSRRKSSRKKRSTRRKRSPSRKLRNKPRKSKSRTRKLRSKRRKSKSRTRKLLSRRRKSSRMQNVFEVAAAADDPTIVELRENRQTGDRRRDERDVEECLNLIVQSEDWARETGHDEVIISSILLDYLVLEHDLAPRIIWDGVKRTVRSRIGQEYLNRIPRRFDVDATTDRFHATVINTINDLANSLSLGG